MIDEINLTATNRFKFCCKYHWRGVVLFLTPLIFLPLLLFKPIKALRCAYILCVMATYWITEVLPVYVTALIPIIAMPLMGIMSSNETCMQYMKDVVMFFIVSMMIALAVEYCRLHTRIALAVISVVGCSPRKLHFSLMAVTTFVSFWCSNSATAAMMCPVAKAILIQLDEQGMIKFNNDRDQESEEEFPYPSKVTISFFLGIAYSASIGGCATLIGTGTNLAVKGLYDERFPESGELTFNKFMFFNLPAVLVLFLLTFLWLEVLLMGMFRPNSTAAKELEIGEDGKNIAMTLIQQKREELGRVTSAEIIIGLYFVLMILLLFFMKPDFFPGYADLMNEKEIKASVPSILVALILFMTPATWFFCQYFVCSKPTEDKPAESLMKWNYIQQNMPWGIFLLLGGGFALSKGITESKLAFLVGQKLEILSSLPDIAVQLCCIIAGIAFTAFSSNVAIVNILQPVVFEIALQAEMHPLSLSLPVGMTCSLAFHLPVSTPPNAIVAGLVNIRTKDMAIAGIGPTLFSILVYFLFCRLWGPVVFNGFNEFPAWAKSKQKV